MSNTPSSLDFTSLHPASVGLKLETVCNAEHNKTICSLGSNFQASFFINGNLPENEPYYNEFPISKQFI